MANKSGEQVRQMAALAVEHLVKEFESGKSDSLEIYLNALSKLHNYSSRNVLLISAQRPTATLVHTLQAWAKLGRQVVDGEKGILIQAPSFAKNREATPSTPTTEQTSGSMNQDRRPVNFHGMYVYDVEQTKGEPLDEPAIGDTNQHLDKLKSFVAKEGISLEYDRSVTPGFGASSAGTIRLSPSMQPEEEFSELVRELSHEMLDRGKSSTEIPSTTLGARAEAIANVVSKGIGLEADSPSANYIALYLGDEKTLKQSLSVIHDVSSRILDELVPRQRQGPAQDRTGNESQSNGKPEHSLLEDILEPHPVDPKPMTLSPDQSDSMSFDR